MVEPLKAPLEPLSGDELVICIPVEYWPFFRMLFERMERRAAWSSDFDYRMAYARFVEIEASFMPLTDIVREIRALRGVQPAFASIPEPNRTIDMYSSVQQMVDTLKASQGTLTSGWFGEQSTPATLADVVRAGQGSRSTAGTSQLTMIKDILSAGGSMASIIGFLEDTLADGTDTVVDVGLGVANIIMLAALAGQLQAMSFQLAAITSNSGDVDRLTRMLDNVYNGTYYENEWESHQSLRLDVRAILDAIKSGDGSIPAEQLALLQEISGKLS